MNPDFWHARWRHGEIGWHKDEINAHLQEHWPRLGVSPRSGSVTRLRVCSYATSVCSGPRSGAIIRRMRWNRLAFSLMDARTRTFNFGSRDASSDGCASSCMDARPKIDDFS